MPKLGLGTGFSRSGIVTPGVVTDSLVMKHMYPAGAVQPVSDGAAYFLGSATDYVEISDNASINIGTGDMTLSAWIWMDDVSAANHGLFGKREGEAKRWYLRVKSDGALNFYGKATDSGTVITQGSSNTGLIVDKTWTHVAAVLDSSANVKFYKNGVLDATATGGTHNLDKDNTGSLYLGSVGDNSGTTLDPLTGYMCNAGMWKRILTQAEIKSIMWKQHADLTTGTGSESENLVSWWNLDNTITTDGTVNFVLDEADTTLTTAPEQTWVVQAGSPSVSGQEITMTAGEVQQVGCTLSTGTGYYKVNMTVEDYSGSGSLSLLWDGNASSDLTTTANGTFEWITYLDASPNIHSASGAAGKITVNSIKKYNGNAGQLS